MAEPGCLHDAHFQNLEVSGYMSGGVHTLANVTAQTAIGDGVLIPLSGAGAIDSNTHLVLVTTSADGNKQIYLPPPSTLLIGHTITIIISAFGCEILSGQSGAGAVNINGLQATGNDNKPDKEYTIGVNTISTAIVTSANDWIIYTVARGAAPGAL